MRGGLPWAAMVAASRGPRRPPDARVRYRARRAPSRRALTTAAVSPPGPPRVLVAVPDPALRTDDGGGPRPAFTWSRPPEAASALASALQAAPDVVLADVAVGDDLIRALRADRRTRGVPVIVMTTRTERDGVPQGLDARCRRIPAQARSRPASWPRASTRRPRRAWARDEALRVEASARAEAEASNRAKDEFIAMISHELRTPLGAILIWAQLLKSDDARPGRGRRARSGMIERSTKTLAQLIDDLLDASRIIAGKLTFETRPLELRPVVEAALDAASPGRAGQGHASSSASLPGPLPPVSGRRRGGCSRS